MTLDPDTVIGGRQDRRQPDPAVRIQPHDMELRGTGLALIQVGIRHYDGCDGFICYQCRREIVILMRC